MITINNKSRYFSASEDMFPTMERNFAWLFGMQTPEQGWKAAMAKAIYRSARASSAEEWQYGFPIGDDGEPMLIEDDFLADLMAAYLEKLPDVAPQAHSFEERRAMMKRLFPLKHTKEYYEIRLDSVMNENPGEFTLEDYLRGVGRCAREELMDKFGPHDSGLDSYFQTVFRKINRIGAERFSREAELLAEWEKVFGLLEAHQDKRIRWQYSEQFASIYQYMHAHFRDSGLSLTALAEEFGMSVSTLSREFQKNLGQGFLDSLHQMRIEEAKYAIENTNASLNDIAISVGYTNTLTMTRAFKKYLGCTPGSFRKKEDIS